MTWPDRIRSIRAARGWSQQQLADYLRVRRATVADWERGAHEPSGPASVLLEQLEPGNPPRPAV